MQFKNKNLIIFQFWEIWQILILSAFKYSWIEKRCVITFFFFIFLKREKNALKGQIENSLYLCIYDCNYVWSTLTLMTRPIYVNGRVKEPSVEVSTAVNVRFALNGSRGISFAWKPRMFALVTHHYCTFTFGSQNCAEKEKNQIQSNLSYRTLSCLIFWISNFYTVFENLENLNKWKKFNTVKPFKLDAAFFKNWTILNAKIEKLYCSQHFSNWTLN